MPASWAATEMTKTGASRSKGCGSCEPCGVLVISELPSDGAEQLRPRVLDADRVGERGQRGALFIGQTSWYDHLDADQQVALGAVPLGHALAPDPECPSVRRPWGNAE